MLAEILTLGQCYFRSFCVWVELISTWISAISRGQVGLNHFLRVMFRDISCIRLHSSTTKMALVFVACYVAEQRH